MLEKQSYNIKYYLKLLNYYFNFKVILTIFNPKDRTFGTILVTIKVINEKHIPIYDT